VKQQESYEVDGKKPSDINNFKILNYNTEKNQNLIEQLRLGTYANYRIFFNPLNGTITNPGKIKFTQSEYASKTTNLGQELN